MKAGLVGRNRKAIAAAVTGFFGALGTALLDGHITVAEDAGIVAATCVAFAGVWATAANTPPA